MVRCLTLTAAMVILAGLAQASTVMQRGYTYSYGVAGCTGSDRQYVICEEEARPPLVPELKPPPIAIRFGNIASTPPLLTEPAKTAELPHPPDYRLENTILFSLDSAEIRDGSALIRFAQNLKNDPSVAGIRVKGFTCDLGSKDHNDRLAMRRAVAVATILGGVGLKSDEVTGIGKCCYIPGERSLSRRVEISVKRSKKEEGRDEK